MFPVPGVFIINKCWEYLAGFQFKVKKFISEGPFNLCCNFTFYKNKNIPVRIMFCIPTGTGAKENNFCSRINTFYFIPYQSCYVCTLFIHTAKLRKKFFYQQVCLNLPVTVWGYALQAQPDISLTKCQDEVSWHHEYSGRHKLSRSQKSVKVQDFNWAQIRALTTVASAKAGFAHRLRRT